MNPHDISHATDPDVRASLPAVRRAAALARKTAIQTNTDLIVVRAGRLIKVSVDTLRKRAGAGKRFRRVAGNRH